MSINSNSRWMRQARPAPCSSRNYYAGISGSGATFMLLGVIVAARMSCAEIASFSTEARYAQKQYNEAGAQFLRSSECIITVESGSPTDSGGRMHHTSDP
jgi:hypothetical protein